MPNFYLLSGYKKVSGPLYVNLTLIYTLLTAIIILMATYGNIYITVIETTIGIVLTLQYFVSVVTNNLRINWSKLFITKAISITTIYFFITIQSNFIRRPPILDIVLSI